MTRVWGHSEDKHGRMPYSWVADHEIEPSAEDGMCTGCGGPVALVWTETWDCGCVFAVAEGALVAPCAAHGEDAARVAGRTAPEHGHDVASDDGEGAPDDAGGRVGDLGPAGHDAGLED